MVWLRIYGSSSRPQAADSSTSEREDKPALYAKVEPDFAEMAERYGPDIPVPEWRKRLVCSRCGSRRRRLSLWESHDTDMVVSGERR